VAHVLVGEPVPTSPEHALARTIKSDGEPVTLKADHVAGGAFIAFGILVFALSGDLPFGTMSGPGAGMMPKLMAGLMIVFAAATIIGGAESPPFSEIDWSDRGHAILLVGITAVAVSLYQTLGFLITMALLVFALLIVVERRPLINAALYSVGLTLFAYWLFAKALKAPLPRGLIWF
jgi:putative tricarboxylic transport membrane protein